MTQKIDFVVVDNNVFGYIDPRQPNLVCILATSPIRGSCLFWWDGPIPVPTSGIRPARIQDFADFRISTKGYDSHPELYNFPLN